MMRSQSPSCTPVNRQFLACIIPGVHCWTFIASRTFARPAPIVPIVVVRLGQRIIYDARTGQRVHCQINTRLGLCWVGDQCTLPDVAPDTLRNIWCCDSVFESAQLLLRLPNQRATWVLLICWTACIAWLIRFKSHDSQQMQCTTSNG